MPCINFPNIAWVVAVSVDPVVMHVTSITPASQGFPVLAGMAVAVAHEALKFLGLPLSEWFCGKWCLVRRPEGGRAGEGGEV